jgi:RNA 2',3'-cyclic 3'-phosphodiesterase
MALRCFIAVEMPEDLKTAIGTVIEDLKKTGADIKWVGPENIHITLKFLGATEEELLKPICDALSAKLARYTPFYIKIAYVGCFPDERRPRVVWVGIQDTGLLKEIQEEIETGMEKFGFPPEKRAFSPHITIGRVKSQKRVPEMMKILKKYSSAHFADMEIKAAALMKSELRPAGAQYSRLAEIPFSGRNNV